MHRERVPPIDDRLREGLVGALDPDAPRVHTAMASNLAIDHSIETGDIAKQFSGAAEIVEHTFRFERQTAVSLEPAASLRRSIEISAS